MAIRTAMAGLTVTAISASIIERSLAAVHNKRARFWGCARLQLLNLLAHSFPVAPSVAVGQGAYVSSKDHPSELYDYFFGVDGRPALPPPSYDAYGRPLAPYGVPGY